MESINLRRFAFLYFQEVKPGHYDWENRKHRVACRAYFVNLEGKRDKKAMKAALAKYLKEVKAEFEELK